MKIKFILIFLALCGICFADLPGPVSYTDGVCNFRLYGYEMTPPIQKAILFGIDQILTTYKDEFLLRYSDNFRVNVIIIQDHDAFLEFQKQHRRKVISTSGYYSGEKKEAVVWANKSTKRMLKVLFHEASHMILRNQIPVVPMWVNEGLSEYFEGLNVIGKKKQINLQQNKHSRMKKWATEGMPKEKDSNAAYTLGYEVVYFMMSSSRNQKVLGQMINRLRTEHQNIKTTAMFDEYYKGGFAKFQQHWFKWIPKARKSRPLRSLKKKAPAKKTPTDTTI